MDNIVGLYLEDITEATLDRYVDCTVFGIGGEDIRLKYVVDDLIEGKREGYYVVAEVV